MKRHSHLVVVTCLAAALMTSGSAQAAEWKPDRMVELVAGTAPGGSQDRTLRTVQRIMQDARIVDVPVTISNRPGGGGTLALAYLAQHKGDARLVYLASPTMVTNHINGTTKIGHNDLTPLANLLTEYIGFTVRADGPIRDGRHFVELLRKDPASLSIAIGTALGNGNHIALAQVLRSAGMGAADVRRLKVLAFKAGSEGMAALLGGHIDALVLTPTGIPAQLQAGKLRMIGITAPVRLGGALAGVPTWKEQGVNSVVDNWRALIGPPGLDAAQVAFWEATLAQVVKSEGWRRELEENYWANDFRTSRDTRAMLDQEYAELRKAMTDLGLAR